MHMGIKETVEGHREGVLYIMFGALTTLVSWGTYSLFVLLGIEVNISNVMSWICAVLFAFVVNKWFVFLSRSTEKRTLLRELGSFFSARILTGVIAIVTFPILYAIGFSGGLFNIDGLYAKIIVTLIEIVLNYLFSKYLVFRKPKNENEGTE